MNIWERKFWRLIRCFEHDAHVGSGENRKEAKAYFHLLLRSDGRVYYRNDLKDGYDQTLIDREFDTQLYTNADAMAYFESSVFNEEFERLMKNSKGTELIYKKELIAA